MMGLAYGTPIRGLDIAGAKREAQRRTVAGFEYWWRVESVRYAQCVDPDADLYCSSEPRLELFALPVKKRTPKGVRLWEGRWIPSDPNAKQYAGETPEAALGQFIQRRRAQIWILEKQLARARADLDLTKPPAVGLPPAPRNGGSDRP